MSNWLWHLTTGSQVSPISTTPLPHIAGQLLSLFRLQPERAAAVAVGAHGDGAAVHALAGAHRPSQRAQLAAHGRAGRRAVGAVALLAAGRLGHAVAALAHAVVVVHGGAAAGAAAVTVGAGGDHAVVDALGVALGGAALQLAALAAHGRAAGGAVGPSHFSLPSRTPLPQRALQSLSLVLLQADGQQPSPLAQAVCMPSSTQRAVQLSALPSSLRRPQPFQGQLRGHIDGGSQVSPASMAPLPQRAVQSLSLVALQPPGQQPSPLTHWVCMTSFTHWAWQVPPLTRRRSWQPIGRTGLRAAASGIAGLPAGATRRCRCRRRTRSPGRWRRCSPSGSTQSPVTQAVCLPASTHLASQVREDPSIFCRVQPMAGHAGRAAVAGIAGLAGLDDHVPAAGPAVAVVGGVAGAGAAAVAADTLGLHAVVHAPGLAAAAFGQLALVQPMFGHIVGQLLSGSQVSPGSTLLLPQLAPGVFPGASVAASVPAPVPASLARSTRHDDPVAIFGAQLGATRFGTAGCDVRVGRERHLLTAVSTGTVWLRGVTDQAARGIFGSKEQPATRPSSREQVKTSDRMDSISDRPACAAR